MKQLLIFIKKEFYHVFRDRKTLLMLFGLPIVQIVLFGFALSNEIKNAKIVVVDYAHDEVTRQLIEKIQASRYFDIEESRMDAKQIEKSFRGGEIKMALVFPSGFANSLHHNNKANVQVIADASDPNTATALTNYIQSIINGFQTVKDAGKVPRMQIVPEIKMLYNPELKGAPNFVPGVMALVLMLVCTMMSSIAIVKEKELGTMEILLVSPFKPVYIIISKLMPYLLISIMNLIIILVLSVTLLELEIKGNILLLVGESTLFVLTSLAIGLLISTTAKTMQAAMMGSLMGMMLPTLLLTGFMFPIENMPLPMQLLSNIVPSRWYFMIVKDVMLKGLGFTAVWKETLILFSMSAFLLIFSWKKFKIRLQ